MDGFRQGGRECGAVGGEVIQRGRGGLEPVRFRGEVGERVGEMGDGELARGDDDLGELRGDGMRMRGR